MVKRIEPGPRYSQAVVHGKVVYLAGQVATDTSADVAGQTHQVLASIERVLAAAGSDKTRILTATIYLADMANFAAMNQVWDAWVAPGAAPTRATVEGKLATPAYKIEIVVTAAVP